MRTRPLSNRPNRLGFAAAASLVALATLTAYPSSAAAQEQVSSGGKGIVGGALMGAEAITIVESLAGAHATWAYGVGALVGAAGGGVGGYFVEQNSSDGRVPMYMLAVGAGLVIPALVLSLNAMRYRPSDSASEDRAPTNAPPANPGLPNGASVVAPAPAPAGGSGMPVPSPPPAAVPTPTAPAPAATPAPTPATAPPPASGGGKPPSLSLLDLSAGSMRVGLPVPEVRPLYSLSELRQYGMAQQTEVRMPLVKIAF